MLSHQVRDCSASVGPRALPFDTGLILGDPGRLIPAVLECPSSTSSLTLLYRIGCNVWRAEATVTREV